MTVDELITHLQQLPPNARLFVEGYESGMNDMRAIEAVAVKLDANEDEYGGTHTYYDTHDDGDAPHFDGYLLR